MDSASRLLVVDDNPDICEVLATVLTLEGFDVETANTGQEAVAKFQRGFFNAALLDLRLPDMNGIDLLATLKDLNPDAEEIMVTAFASLDSAIDALNHGAAAYILKPFEIEEVITVVNRTLERQKLAFENRRLLAELEQKNAELERLATTDGLTGVYNRRYFEEMLEREDRRASRYDEPVSLIVVDVNNLKQVNDTLGHDMGDVLITTTARLLAQVSRSSDLVARYGGDEFVILMPETTQEAALHLVRRIREAAQRWDSLPEMASLGLSLAIGAASTSRLVGVRKALHLADARMYRDKEKYYRRQRASNDDNRRHAEGAA